MRIIGFNGGMGVGKSTAIEILKEIEGQSNVKLIKFAGPLYDMQEMIYRRIEPAYKRPGTFIKDRKLLQWLGTEWGRDLKSDIWVSLWKSDVVEERVARVYDLIVCDDVRFDNEAETIRSLGGTVVRITSGRADQRIDTTAGIANHVSEAGISPGLIDFSLQNDGNVEQFRASLTALYKQISGNTSR